MYKKTIKKICLSLKAVITTTGHTKDVSYLFHTHLKFLPFRNDLDFVSEVAELEISLPILSYCRHLMTYF